MKKRFLLTLIIFLILMINVSAQLPDINLSANAYLSNVRLSWTLISSSYGGYGVICNPNWWCSEWSDCINGQKTKSCNDLNNCNTDLNKPAEVQSCINNYGGYGSYGSDASGQIVRNTLTGYRNLITGNSFLDVLKNSLNNINNLLKRAFGQKQVGTKLEEKYKFEIYRDDILIDKDSQDKYCDPNYNCYYEDKNLRNGEYSYYIKILTNDGTGSKTSNIVNIKIIISDYVCSSGQQIGDVNGDGAISDSDALLVQRIVAGLDKMPSDICCADVSKDGTISAFDAAKILLISTGAEQSPGVCMQSQQINAYITLATTKESYLKGERIELTDPPINDKNPINKILQGTAISKDYVTQINYGYIIQFKEDPVLIKKTKLEKELQQIQQKSISYKENYENVNVNVLNFIYQIPAKQINKYLYSTSQSKYVEAQRNLDNELLVYKNEFKDGLNNNIQEVKQELNLDDVNIKKVFEGDLFNGIVLDVDEQKVKEIRKLGNVKDVFPNELVQIVLDKSVPVIKTDVVRNDLGLTGANVTVAIIDTGIDPGHESLDDLDDNLNTNDPKIIGFKDFINFKDEPYDDHGHGTHVSGICCGTGGFDKIYVGVAPKANLVGVKVLNENGGGTFDQVISGMEWVAQNKDKYNIKIASMSLGGYARSKNDPMEYAANALVDYGVTLVVAAGNSGPYQKTIASPGIAEKAITVGAIDNNLDIAEFSSRGPTLDGRIKPDLVAPGVGINAPKANTINEYWRLSGTSMATPHVSGAVALLYQYRPNFDTEKIKEILYGSALDLGKIGKDNIYGYGVVDLANAAIQLNKPLHEVSVYDIGYDITYNSKFVQLNDNVNINAKIKNLGISKENNLKVKFYLNNELIGSSIIYEINPDKIKDVFFNYVAQKVGDNEIKIEVEPVEGELLKTNNKLTRSLKVLEKIKDRINAVVLDSWGNDYSRYAIFNDLNKNWFDYGDYLVNIDYKSLNKEGITYQDIVNTNADVLIISDAWDNGGYTGNNWQYTDSEVEAIKKYVNEGHGIIATSGTFSERVPNNMKLAPLFGMDQSKIGYWADEWSQEMKILYKENIIFNKINENTYHSPVHLNNNDLELNSSENGELLAISTDDKAKIIFNNENANNIYLTSIEELNEQSQFGSTSGLENNKLIFYNAIVLASQKTPKVSNDIRLYDLKADEIVYFGKNYSINAKIKNLGEPQNNIIIDLLINNEVKNAITIDNLQTNEVKELGFDYEPKLGINNITIHAHELPLEKNIFDNYLSSSSISPRAVISSLNDYGLDTNNDGVYNYLVLDINLDVLEDGGYRTLATSLNSGFGVLIQSNVDSYNLMKKGKNTVSLNFDGADINKLGLNGPYKIKDIYVRGENNEQDYYKEYLTKPYSYQDFQSSSDLTIIGMNAPNKMIINTPVNISFDIINIGVEPSYHTTLDIYKEFYNRTYSHNLILHKDLPNIEQSKTLPYSIIFSPDILGQISLLFVINASNDFKQYNNQQALFSNIVPNGPDLIGWINDYGKKIVNIENKISASIINIGVKPLTQSKASLYIIERYYDDNLRIEKENSTLIQEINTGSLAVDEIKYINFSWTPVTTGYKLLRMIVESPEDLNPNNNHVDAWFLVTYDRPDIIPYFYFDKYVWVVNKNYTIYLNLDNIGFRDAHKVNAKLYLEEKENNIKTLILTKSYPLIKGGENERLSFDYNINKIGEFSFTLEVDSEDIDEIRENNIFTSYLTVIPDEADTTISYVIYDYKNFLVNETINTTINVYNQGSKIANDVYLYIYLNTGLTLNLLDKKFVGDINPNEVKSIHSSIKLNELGYNSILYTVNSSNDGNPNNNLYYMSFKIVPKSLIMNLEDRDLEGYLVIYIEKFFLNKNGTWEAGFYRNVVDDLTNNNIRIIKPGEYLALDKIFNQFNITISEWGNYRIYVAFYDTNKSIFSTKSGENLEAYYMFYVQ